MTLGDICGKKGIRFLAEVCIQRCSASRRCRIPSVWHSCGEEVARGGERLAMSTWIQMRERSLDASSAAMRWSICRRCPSISAGEVRASWMQQAEEKGGKRLVERAPALLPPSFRARSSEGRRWAERRPRDGRVRVEPWESGRRCIARKSPCAQAGRSCYRRFSASAARS